MAMRRAWSSWKSDSVSLKVLMYDWGVEWRVTVGRPGVLAGRWMATTLNFFRRNGVMQRGE